MYYKRVFRIFQVVLLSAAVLGLYGCGSKSASDYRAAEPEMKNESMQTETAQKVSNDESVSDAAQGTATSEEIAKPGDPQVSTEVGYNRKIVKKGELQLQTKDFKRSVEGVIAKIQSLGGYVESSDIQGNNLYNEANDRRSASITVRIPQKHFDAFINQSGEFGNIVSTSSNSEDITNNYVDTEIRLKALKARHGRLLELLEKSGSLKDLFTIEQELGEVTYEIEKLSGTLQEYDQMVAMSTLHIQIEEVYKIEENKPVITFGDKIADTFKESVEKLKNLMEGLVLIGVALTPFLVIIVPAGAIIAVVIRKNKKHKEVIPHQKKDEK